MQRKRGELVPIGEVVSGLDDVLVPAIRDDSPQARHHFTRCRSGEPACLGQRSGRRSRLHGANDGAVFVAPHQSRQPDSVQARQRPVPALHAGRGGKTKQIIFSVKAGKVTVSHIRDLVGVISREKAQIGAFLSLEPPLQPHPCVEKRPQRVFTSLPGASIRAFS